MFQTLKTITVLSAILLLVSPLSAAEPTTLQIRMTAADAIRSGTHAQTWNKLTTYVEKRVASTPRLSSRELARLAVAADCIRLMELLEPRSQ